MLNKLYEEAIEKAEAAEYAVLKLEEKVENSGQMKDSLRKKHDDIKTWPDMYGGCGGGRSPYLLTSSGALSRI